MISAKLGRYYIGDNHEPLIMGIINISPESFYKNSIKKIEELHNSINSAIKEGAHIIDIGAASTAPPEYGVPQISKGEELDRIKRALDVIKDIDVDIISIDTMHSEVAEIALKKDVRIINDVSGLKKDNKMAQVIADYDASVIVMAYQNTPGDVENINDIQEELRKSIKIATNAGIDDSKIIIDPGIGFGKPFEKDINIVRSLSRFRILNKPILVGISRKSFIGKILGNMPPEKRLYGSLSATAIAVYNGAHIIRTHDIRETADVTRTAYVIKPKEINHKNIEILTWLKNPYDANEVILGIGSQPEGAQIMKNKIALPPILIKSIPSPAATIIKENMLAMGSDAAVHAETVDCHINSSDVLVMGNIFQIKKLIKAISKMPYFNLKQIADDLNESIQLWKQTIE